MKFSLKQFLVGIAIGLVLIFGINQFADAKSRVSSKPSSFSSRSYSKPSVVSRPATLYSAPKVVTRQTPVYRSAPSRTTVIQKNYYGGSNGYNSHRNYGGGYGSGGMGGGSGLGTSIVGGAVGAAGGMLLMDALTEDEGEKALKLQQEQIRIEEAKAQQERDDKQDQILENQKEEQLREEVANEPFFKLNPDLIPSK
jgi:hypothetical protein